MKTKSSSRAPLPATRSSAGSLPIDSGSARADGGGIEEALLAVQRDAGNRAAVALVATLQRAPGRRGRVRIESGEAILGADALAAMLSGTAGEERLNDVPVHARFATKLLLDAMHGESPSGRRGMKAEDRLALLDKMSPKLEAVLAAATRAAGGELEQATRARRKLAAIRTSWVKFASNEAVAEDARAVEFLSPKATADRMTLLAGVKGAIAVYQRGEKFLAGTDIAGLGKDLRSARIQAFNGLLLVASADSWPSYSKAVAAVDAQLARTDPDRMLGAGAEVLVQLKKATTFVTTSVELLGSALRYTMMAKGMVQEAAQLSKSLEGLGKFSKALVVVDLVANAMILLDSQASGSKKLGAGLGFAGGTASVASATGEALGMAETAAAAGTASTVLLGAAVTYESYKALAEYGYTSVVGGLSYVAIDEELEGEHVIRGNRRTRLGGLEPLGRAVALHRTKVEALAARAAAASDRDREGVGLALGNEVVLLQNALYALAKRWGTSQQPAVRARLPEEDRLSWENAMSPGTEPFMVVDMATRWEAALTAMFASKDAIVNETMHASMKGK